MNGQLFPNHQQTAVVGKHSGHFLFVINLFFLTLQPLSTANPAAPCHHKGTSLHVTPPRKGHLISLKTSFFISSLLTLVSLCLSMHPRWAGLRCKEKTQVRETLMQFKRLETHPNRRFSRDETDLLAQRVKARERVRQWGTSKVVKRRRRRKRNVLKEHSSLPHLLASPGQLHNPFTATFGWGNTMTKSPWSWIHQTLTETELIFLPVLGRPLSQT